MVARWLAGWDRMALGRWMRRVGSVLWLWLLLLLLPYIVRGGNNGRIAKQSKQAMRGEQIAAALVLFSIQNLAMMMV